MRRVGAASNVCGALGGAGLTGPAQQGQLVPPEALAPLPAPPAGRALWAELGEDAGLARPVRQEGARRFWRTDQGLVFVTEGARVVVNDLDAARAAEVAAAIPGALGVAADVASKAAVDVLFDRVEAEFGRIDVLVNNAGNIYAARHFLEGDEAWWDQVLGVNLKGAYLCSDRAARSMVRRRSGVILHMSSGGATKAHRGNVAYDASKGGIEAMTRAMALDLAPYGIRVNAVVPGLIRTYDISDEQAAERGEVVPLGR